MQLPAPSSHKQWNKTRLSSSVCSVYCRLQVRSVRLRPPTPRRRSLKLKRTMIRASALVALGMLILACGTDPAVSRELPVHGKQ